MSPPPLSVLGGPDITGPVDGSRQFGCHYGAYRAATAGGALLPNYRSTTAPASTRINITARHPPQRANSALLSML